MLGRHSWPGKLFLKGAGFQVSVKKLFNKKMVVLNIGVKLFAESLQQQGVKTAQVSWRPPVDRETERLLRKVL